MRTIPYAAIVTAPLIVWLGISTALAPAVSMARDWKKYPAIVEIDRQPARLFAIGDVHGDYDRLIVLLGAARLIAAAPKRPEDVHWTGGDAVLVQTGDMIDKGPHSVAVLRLLAALRESARQAGGQVVITMGNHEAEFLGGPDPKKAKDFIDDLNANGIRESDVLECDGDIGQFLCNLPFGAKIGGWFFSHAGNTAGSTLPQLSQSLEKGVDKDGFATSELSDPNSILEARLGDKLWFDPAMLDPPAGAAEPASQRQVLAANAAALGVSHIVQGHQPGDVTFEDGIMRHKGEMFQRWGLLFLTDAGLSAGIDDSAGAVLRILNGTEASALCAGGQITQLWSAASAPDLGRAAPCH